MLQKERLRKVYFVLENILGSPVDGQGMTYSLKSQAKGLLLDLSRLGKHIQDKNAYISPICFLYQRFGIDGSPG